MPRIGGLSKFFLVGAAAYLMACGAPEALGNQTAPRTATAQAATGDVLRLTQVPPTPTPTPTPAPTTPTPATSPEGAGPAVAAPPPAVSPVESSLAQPPPDQGLFALLLGPGPQAGRSTRLASVPNMFGDSFGLGGGLVWIDPDLALPGPAGSGPLPLAGASRRVKVVENNKALPMDRVYFTYNHFHHALEYEAVNIAGTPIRRAFSVNRFTMAAEKTLAGGLYSVEVRMPLAGTGDFDSGRFGVSDGEIGNLAVLLKCLVFQTNTTAAAIGLSIDLPTGSDVTGYADVLRYRLRNEAVHLGPYAGFLWEPDNRFFCQGFLQVDIPTNGNTVDVDNLDLAFPSSGRLHEQTAMYLDFGAGYWLCRNPQARFLTGLATAIEVHYATTLTDADSLLFGDGVNTLIFGNPANRLDEVNLTVGLQAELRRNTLFRVAGVFPLSDDNNRSFDSELQVQVERRF